MYSVEHLQARHQKQMDRLAKKQEKSAQRLLLQRQKMDSAFQQFRNELSENLYENSCAKATMPSVGFITMLRSFLL